RGLAVVSPMSAATVADLSDRDAGERLGASHLLRGTLRRAGERFRVGASLIDCAAGTQLWAERIEAGEADFLGIGGEVVGRIAASLAARIEDAALAESRGRPTDSLAAYGLTIRGLALLRRGTLEADSEARGLFERALALDAGYARAHAGLSLSWFNEWSCQHWHVMDENGCRAYAHAHTALDLDDRDAMLHLVIGRVRLYRREFEQAAWYFDRAVALCPNDADLLIQLGMAETFLGRIGLALDHARRAMRLNPYHPNYYYAYAAHAHLIARDPAKALELAARVDALPFVDAPAYLAIAHAHLGRMDEARGFHRAFLDRFRATITGGREPAPGEAIGWFVQVNPYRRGEDMAFLLAGFRLLGEVVPGEARADAASGAPDRPAGAALHRRGEGWEADYAGRRALLPDLKGLRDIRRLLAEPGRAVHCLDLAERAGDLFTGDAVLDERARSALGSRIRDLQEDVDEAEAMNDPGRAARARAEMEELVETLSRALGLGGRGRRLGDASERARTAVTWRIRHAAKRIEAAHPELGRHLANSVRTGAFCTYSPERAVRWTLDEATAPAPA
ncbi:MAG TPA: hypothetical protein VFJ13_00660, partial [Paracoccaceae bacterium]|nr:hypothetical protein [Paracoccaceae bacterium]